MRKLKTFESNFWLPSPHFQTIWASKFRYIKPLKTKKEASTPNLIMTSHSAFYSKQSMYDMRYTGASIAKDILQGKKPENCINCEYLPSNWLKNRMNP